MAAAAVAAFVCQFSTRAIVDIMYANFSDGEGDIYENVLPPRKVQQRFPPERFFSHCAYFIISIRRISSLFAF
jgi:hypothetical protein